MQDQYDAKKQLAKALPDMDRLTTQPSRAHHASPGTAQE
jgi:hypothetical protein